MSKAGEKKNLYPIYQENKRKKMKNKDYEKELTRLEVELVKLQGWIQAQGLNIVVIFEGRDSAGKGGVIERITYRLNPRVVRIVATPTPTDRQKSQWYFLRYVPHLPAAGEIILFDRSWYNRAGMEHVMSFCTEEEYLDFIGTVNGYELSRIRAGIKVINRWLDISDETQELRFKQRLDDPRRRWKLGPMDLQARVRWVEYSKARDPMLVHTETDHAPWYIVNANVKKNARVNIIAHLSSLIPYEDLTPEPLELPPRQEAGDYKHPDVSHFNIVPAVFP